MRAWFVTVAAVLTVIGLSSPRVAGRSGQLLLLAIGLAIAVIAVQPIFATIEKRSSEPFVPTPPRTPRATMPNQMAQIVDAFTNRARADANGEFVPPHLLRRITAVATGHIVDHHHLHIGDMADHPEIRRLVSPTLWALLLPAEQGSTAPTLTAVTFDDLIDLLDELDRL